MCCLYCHKTSSSSSVSNKHRSSKRAFYPFAMVSLRSPVPIQEGNNMHRLRKLGKSLVLVGASQKGRTTTSTRSSPQPHIFASESGHQTDRSPGGYCRCTSLSSIHPAAERKPLAEWKKQTDG